MEGNPTKIREALEFVHDKLLTWNYTDKATAKMAVAVVDRCSKALSAPPRNCDVGTANEHMRRFRLFCQAHQSPMSGMCDPICPLCGNPDKSHCITEWMLMPYSEGEGK